MSLQSQIAKKRSCGNIQYWRRKIINHAYFLHFKYAKSRQLGLNYWKAVLPHVTGRHTNLGKVSSAIIREIKRNIDSYSNPSKYRLPYHLILLDSLPGRNQTVQAQEAAAINIASNQER